MELVKSNTREIPRIIVFISGTGSNLGALLSANIPIALVFSNNLEAKGLDIAKSYNVPTLVLVKAKGEKRIEYDTRILSALPDCDLIVLAGYMLLLSPCIYDKYETINLHPALPGAYPGLNAIERAFADFQSGQIQATGIMIHRVVQEVDAGTVLETGTVKFIKGESLQDFEVRIHEKEHEIIVRTVKEYIKGTSIASLCRIQVTANTQQKRQSPMTSFSGKFQSNDTECTKDIMLYRLFMKLVRIIQRDESKLLLEMYNDILVDGNDLLYFFSNYQIDFSLMLYHKTWKHYFKKCIEQ